MVSLRIRDHKIANTQKEKEGHVAKPRKAVWVREPEARCVRTGEKSAVFQPSGKKKLSASRSTISDTVPFYRFAALRHVAEEDSRTHARSLGRYFFLKISTNHQRVVFHDRTIGHEAFPI